MRGASDTLTSASAHPRAWRGEGERKRARAARVVNKSLLMSKAQRASERVAMSSGVSSTSHNEFIGEQERDLKHQKTLVRAL